MHMTFMHMLKTFVFGPKNRITSLTAINITVCFFLSPSTYLTVRKTLHIKNWTNLFTIIIIVIKIKKGFLNRKERFLSFYDYSIIHASWNLGLRRRWLLLSKMGLALQFSIFLVSSFLLKISCLFHFSRKMKQKMGNTLIEFKHLLSFSSIDLFDVKDFKRNLTDGNLIRKRVLKRIWCCSFHG